MAIDIQEQANLFFTSQGQVKIRAKVKYLAISL